MGNTSAPVVTRDLMALLSHSSHVLLTELTAGLAGLGITMRHYCVLQQALPGELTQIRLAELCDLDKTTMVVTVDELERAGLAERRPSATDRRARIIAVTASGERLVREAQTVVERIYDDVLSSLSASEREGFVTGLERLVGGRLSTPVPCERPVRRRSSRS